MESAAENRDPNEQKPEVVDGPPKNALASTNVPNLPDLPGGAVEKEKPKTLYDLINSEKMKVALAAIIPKHMTVEKVIKIAVSTITRNPAIGQCTPGSLLNAIMDGAQLGLPIDGTLGQGYLVPFNNKKTNAKEATFIIGYRGLLTLARRSGQIQAVSARLVYKDDEFHVQYGDNPKIVHVPSLLSEPVDENITGAYFVTKLKDGSDPIIEYMTRKQLDAIRARAPGRNADAWKFHYGEMCRKTVTRRGCKWVPMDIEDKLAKALSREDLIDEQLQGGGLSFDLPLPKSPSPQDVIEGEVGEPQRNHTDPDPSGTTPGSVAAAENGPAQAGNGAAAEEVPAEEAPAEAGNGAAASQAPPRKSSPGDLF